MFPFRSPRPRGLDWLQVEVTSRCNASCMYCPHTVYRSKWRDRDLPLSAFNKLRQDFPNISMIYLQGWGEPFLHPDYFEMLRLAKEAGCKVGSTSNGALLDEDTLRRLVDEGLDDLAFSLAGTSEETNDRFRHGAPLARVLRTIETLQTIKAQRDSRTPVIHVAYMLLRSAREDLRKLPGLLMRAGVTECVVSPLSFVPTRALEKEAFLPWGRPEEGVSDRQARAELRSLKRQLFRLSLGAATQGINLFYHAMKTRPRRSCTENPGKALVVGSNGDVSPCVLAQMPVSGQVNHRYAGRDQVFEPLILGNVRDASPLDLRDSRLCQDFLRGLKRGRPLANCGHCWKRHTITE